MEILLASGGGSRGSFQSGVLYSLFKSGKKFDKIVGTSVGSLNSLILAHCYTVNSPDLLKKTWTEIITKDSSVYEKNYLKSIILRAPYSLEPLEKLIKKYIDLEAIIKSETEIILTSCDLISGESQFISSKTLSAEELLLVALGSSSMPPVFPPVSFRDLQLVDGGVRDNLAIKAIRDDLDISVTIVLCSPLSMQITPKKYKNIFKISGRVIDMMMDECMRNDLENMLLIDELLKTASKKSKIKMYLEASGKKIIDAKIIAPKTWVTESSLEFNQEDLIKGFELGENFSEVECKPLFV